MAQTLAAKAAKARYRARNPNHDYEGRLRREYGLTIADYERRLLTQGGVCAVCREQHAGRRLAVDHDHQSGEVRGLLCFRCNMAIGYARDSALILRVAAAYLEKGRS